MITNLAVVEVGPNILTALTAILAFLTVVLTSQAKHQVASVKEDTIALSDAVNHKEHGMPTLVQRVVDQDERSIRLAEDLAAFRSWQTEALKVMASSQSISLPPEPSIVPAEKIPLPIQNIESLNRTGEQPVTTKGDKEHGTNASS